MHAQSLWTCAVSTGALLLGAAGLLEGVRATTHWLAKDALRQQGAQVLEERFVADGKILTSAGVSAGIDMALWLAGQLEGEQVARRIQLSLEYEPRPPFDSGTPQQAGPELVEQVRASSRFR